MKIFVAGATGALGLPLVRTLCALGHEVTGMTRGGPGVDRLRELGASVSTADAFDRQAVRNAIASAKPEVVIDQLTWLPANPADIVNSMPNDTRLHKEVEPICSRRQRIWALGVTFFNRVAFISTLSQAGSPTRPPDSATMPRVRSVRARA